MSRKDHQFEFSAERIAAAAGSLAVYHDDRARHWEEQRSIALERVKETAGVKIIESVTVTNGPPEVQLAIDYGDQEAWTNFRLADSKLKRHIAARDSYLVDQRVYTTQNNRPYTLSVDDVAHFKLGGEQKED